LVEVSIMAKLIDMTGKTYGTLFVLYKIPRGEHRSTQAFWRVRCHCGKEFPSVGWTIRSGHTKSCGCLQREAVRVRNAKTALPEGEAEKNCVLRVYRRGAKRRNLVWTLSPSDFFFLTTKNCFYCGGLPTNRSHKPNQHGDFIYNGIDRLDNSLGYTLENTVSCCQKCNWMKNKISAREFLAHVKQIQAYQDKKTIPCFDEASR
jgi:hypothetical protein